MLRKRIIILRGFSLLVPILQSEVEEKPLVHSERRDQSPFTVDNTNISPVTPEERQEEAVKEDDLDIPAFIRRKMKDRDEDK